MRQSPMTYFRLSRLSTNNNASSIFTDPEDTIVDIGEERPSYRGSLVIVPTPIGNLGDLSVRQIEALTRCDIIACEDTRKTGKMLEMILQKRMKERFKTHFGSTYEDFFDGDKTIIMDEESFQKSQQEPSENFQQPKEPEEQTNSQETEF